MHSGTITVRKRLMPLQPMLSAASSRELSMFFMAPETYRNTSGNSLERHDQHDAAEAVDVRDGDAEVFEEGGDDTAATQQQDP